MNASILLALASALLGCASVYLASPHQRWRPVPCPAKLARRLGSLLLVASWIAFAHCMQTVAAVFAFVTTLMLAFILLPYAGALVSLRRDR